MSKIKLLRLLVEINSIFMEKTIAFLFLNLLAFMHESQNMHVFPLCLITRSDGQELIGSPKLHIQGEMAVLV